MKTGDIFICKVCGLPIRNRQEALAPNSERFFCQKCDVCNGARPQEMLSLKNDLLDQLGRIVVKLYRRMHSGSNPPAEFLNAVRDRLSSHKNPADNAIESITCVLKPDSSDDILLRQVAQSERTLAGFYYLSGKRHAHANSNTVLRHWVALANHMKSLVKSNAAVDYNTILKELMKGRYELGLPRLARLIGDNPVAIDRDPRKYSQFRIDHLLGRHKEDHIPALIEQTKNVYPNITGYNIKEVLRFAGNACFITEHDQVIEFRDQKDKDKEKDYLCKYLLQDQILIVIDDVQFSTGNGANPIDNMRLAELVTIYPLQTAAQRLAHNLASRRYLPNCVNLPELVDLMDDIEAKLACPPAA
jgi:hypothetical protein